MVNTAELTQERADEVAGKFAEFWNKDWGLVIDGICQRTNLTRSEAMAFYAMMSINTYVQRSLDFWDKNAGTQVKLNRVIDHINDELNSEDEILGRE